MTSFWEETRNVFRNTGLHFRTGVSFMLPFLLIGGFLGSMASLGTAAADAPLWRLLRQIGEIGIGYFTVVMAAYIAKSIADNAGIAPGLIVGLLAKQAGLGYIGAFLGGLLVGYATHMLMRIRLPELWRTTWGMVAPVFSTLLVALFLTFVVAAPVSWLMATIKQLLFSLQSSGNALLGAVMGILGGLDFGGPFSKIQSTFATAVMEMKLYVPLGITAAFVTVPPLGMCLATHLAPELYSESERDYARQSWLYALIGGFTEIVIPLAAGDIVRVTIASVCGCTVTGFIAGWFQLQLYTPVLGLPQWFFFDRPWVYWMSLAVGVVIVALVSNLLKGLKRRSDKRRAEGSGT